MRSVIKSEIAIVIRKLLDEQNCSECPLREACDIYEQQGVLSGQSICILLNKQSE